MAEAAKKKEEAVTPEAKGEEKPKTKLDLLGIIIFALVSINLITVGGLGFFVQKMWKQIRVLKEEVAKPKEEASHEEESKTDLGKELSPQNLGTLYPIDSFLVNITSDQGAKFLQTQMELELSDPSVEEEISRKKAAIRDAIIVLLSSRSYKELREPAGLKKLRGDILQSVNTLLASGKVKEVYFTQFHFN